VGEPYAPEENTTAYYLTQIAEGLADGAEVSVLCGQPSYLSRGIRAPRFERLGGVSVRRCLGTTLDKNVMPFRLTNMLTLGTSMFLNALFRFRKGDKVLVVSAPPSLPFLMALASRVRRAKFYYLLHDKYPEQLVATGIAGDDDLLVRLLRRMNRWLYSKSERIITVGRDMEEIVCGSPGARPGSVCTIQNWASLEEVRPSERADNELLRELGLLDRFVVLYAGNMGHPQDIVSIVEAAELLKAQGRDDIHFLFIGAGGKKKWLAAEKEKRSLDNLTILDPRPRSDQILFLNACDLAIVTLVRGMKGLAMPSRTYNFMAARKPILAIVEGGSETALVVEEEDCGWVVPPHDPDLLVKAILDAASDPARLDEMGERALAAARSKYDFPTALEKYRNEMEIVDGWRAFRPGASYRRLRGRGRTAGPGAVGAGRESASRFQNGAGRRLSHRG